jgi:hypothetical protein
MRMILCLLANHESGVDGVYLLLLLIGSRVVSCMAQDEEASDGYGDCAECRGEYKAKMVESKLPPQGLLDNYTRLVKATT